MMAPRTTAHSQRVASLLSNNNKPLQIPEQSQSQRMTLAQELQQAGTYPTSPTSEAQSEIDSGARAMNYEQKCLAFARNLQTPLTTLIAGRGASQASFLVHTSILQPYSELYKLCKPISAVEKEAPELSAASTQLVLKDFDPQVVSSLLEYLYKLEYWPEKETIVMQNNADRNYSRSESTLVDPSVSPIFTATAMTSHHFRLALIASKFNLDELTILCREKMVYILEQLVPTELLELVKILYSKDGCYRDIYFEIIAFDNSSGLDDSKADVRNSSSSNSYSGYAGASFWNPGVLKKLMSPPIRQQFLQTLETQGGNFSKDLVMAWWSMGMMDFASSQKTLGDAEGSST